MAWINSFLTNRTQQVVLEGIASGTVDGTSGVPQGSVLGPILFSIFINDLPQSLSSKVRLFADDAILCFEVASADDCRMLQSDLNKLTEWEEKWLMSFNPSKCEVLTVTRKKQPTLFTYIMHDQILNRVKSTKYLGVTITLDLNWNKHINQTAGKANQMLGFVKRNIKTRSHNIKTKAYKSLVHPRLEYCASVCDTHTQSAIQKIEMVQRRTARYVLRRYHNTSSVSDMLEQLQWPTSAQRRCSLRFTMLYKIRNSIFTIDPSPYLEPIRTTTRTNSLSFLPESFKHAYFPRTIPICNTLPDTIVLSPSQNAFKAAVAKYVCSFPSQSF